MLAGEESGEVAGPVARPTRREDRLLGRRATEERRQVVQRPPVGQGLRQVRGHQVGGRRLAETHAELRRIEVAPMTQPGVAVVIDERDGGKG